MTGRLRIAVVANEFPALSETFVLSHVASLLDMGHEVVVLADRPRAETLTHREVERYALTGRTIYRRMPENKVRRALGGAAILARAAVRRDSMPWRALNIGRFGREARSLALLYWIDRLRGEAAFDVIHCHFGTVGRTTAFLRDIGAIRGKLVVTFHGVDVSAVLDADPHAYDHLFRTADLFLPISELWRDRLMACGCPKARTVVHRVGIDTTVFPFRARDWPAGAQGRPLRVICVGRLVEKKGIRFACEAIARVRMRGLAAELTIVGDGPLRAELEQFATQGPLRGHVRFTGWQDRDEVRRLYYASDMLLAPSVTDAAGDKEGIPVTLMEAMASGLPVISTRHSGIPELVDHGISGLLASERDADALAAAIGILAKSPDYARELAARAREKVAAHYDRRALDACLLELYRALANGANAADASSFSHTDRHPVLIRLG